MMIMMIVRVGHRVIVTSYSLIKMMMTTQLIVGLVNKISMATVTMTTNRVPWVSCSIPAPTKFRKGVGTLKTAWKPQLVARIRQMVVRENSRKVSGIQKAEESEANRNVQNSRSNVRLLGDPIIREDF